MGFGPNTDPKNADILCLCKLVSLTNCKDYLKGYTKLPESFSTNKPELLKSNTILFSERKFAPKIQQHGSLVLKV